MSDDELKDFKHDYYSHEGGKYNLEVQVPHLKKLANRYLERYKKSKNWTDLLKSHALYNSVGLRDPDEEEWTMKAFRVQQLYWCSKSNMTYQQGQTVTSCLSNKLSKTRELLRKKLEDMDCLNQFTTENFNADHDLQDKFYKQIRSICTYCTNQMDSVMAEIFQSSVNCLLQKPPCAFVVVALGSIAKGEVTPYSDVEYIFLVAKKDEQTMNYFEMLAMTSYFFIGNLRETDLNVMAIAELSWFDDRQKNGLRIDGLKEKAGKVPTGNGLMTSNCFIMTYEELIAKYTKILDNPKKDALQGDLTSLLQYTREIFWHGAEATNLLSRFVNEKTAIPLNCAREDANRQMLMDDSKRHNFRPETDLIGHAYSVDSKKELYRYPSMLLSDISILARMHEPDSWSTLDTLHRENKISTTIYHSLAFLLAFACYARLSAYLHHDSQDNRLSVLPQGTDLVQEGLVHDETTKRFASRSGKRYYLPLPLFIKYCEHIITLKDHIRNCDDILIRIKEESGEATWVVKFFTCFGCHRWIDASKHFQQHFSETSTSQCQETTVKVLKKVLHHDIQQLWITIKALGYCLSQERNYDKALEYHIETLNILKEPSNATEWEILAECYEEIGTCHAYLNEYGEAETNYEVSLAIRSEHCTDENGKLLGQSHYYIGRCQRLMKKYDSAIKHLRIALRIYHSHASTHITHDDYGYPVSCTDPTSFSLEHVESAASTLKYLNNSSVMLGRVLWTLGNIYCSLKWYQNAFDYLKAASRMHVDSYGKESCHKDTATDLAYLSYSCNKLNNHADADRYIRKGTAIITQLFGAEKPEMLQRLQLAEKQSNHSVVEAQKYYEIATASFCSLPGYSKGHVETAEILLYGTINLIHMNQHGLAEHLLKRIIAIYEQNGRAKLHREDIARVLSAQGLNIWKKTENVELAKKKLIEALNILDSIDTQSAKLEAAETLQNIGLMYEHSRDYNKAGGYLYRAKFRYTSSCNDKSHPKLAEINKQIYDVQLKVKKQNDNVANEINSSLIEIA